MNNIILGPCYIAQVQAIFQPCPPPHSQLEHPYYLAKPLVYVQPFKIVSLSDDWPELGMYVLEREFTLEGRMHQSGLIVSMARITLVVRLVPLYEIESLSSAITSVMSQEMYEHFILNHFSDKEIYNAFHGSLSIGDNEHFGVEYFGG